MTKTLQARIKGKRTELGFSQIEFGAAVGVSQPTVANWENGSHVPRPAAITKISSVLEVGQDWLLTGTRPRDADAALPYLQMPIRHVPVYRWTGFDTAIHPQNIIFYLPLATEKTRLMGFERPRVNGVDKQIEIFDVSMDASRRSKCGIVQSGGALTRIEFKTDLKAQSGDCMAWLYARLSIFSETV